MDKLSATPLNSFNQPSVAVPVHRETAQDERVANKTEQGMDRDIHDKKQKNGYRADERGDERKRAGG